MCEVFNAIFCHNYHIFNTNTTKAWNINSRFYSNDHKNTALGMAKTYLHYGEYEGSEALFRRIEALTTDELWDIANELFRRDNLTVLTYR